MMLTKVKAEVFPVSAMPTTQEAVLWVHILLVQHDEAALLFVDLPYSANI